MEEIIKLKLKEIEQTENIKVLFAVESGSRAWGFASPDSDYDVRFVYVRPKEFYLKLEKRRDVIELPINDLLDINGWDLDKTLKLMYSSNPTLFEWLNSPIVYKTSETHKMLALLQQEYFYATHAIHHYKSMAVSNYREFLKGETVRAKKYFYVLRPVLCCKWILKHGTCPPVPFSELYESMLEKEMVPYVDKLLDIKINSPEIKTIPKIDELNRYLEKSIAEIEEQLKTLDCAYGKNWDKLDKTFLEILNCN